MPKRSVLSKRYSCMVRKLALDVNGARLWEFNEFEPDEAIVEAFDIPEKWQKFGGMDFGYSMPTVVV